MQCLRLAKSFRFLSTQPKLATAEKNFGDLLKRIAVEQKFVNYDLKIDPVSSGGANYTSRLYRVRMAEGERALRMFAKVAALGEKMRSQAPRIYETEHFAYTKMAKIYEELQEEHEVPNQHRLSFPKFYGSNPKEYEETLVLEDLMYAGYESYDRFKSITWLFSRRAVEELAKMHALSFSYEKCRPDDFKQVVGKLKFEYKLEQNDMKTYYSRIINRAVDAVQEKHKHLVADYFKDFDHDDFKALYKTSRGVVIGHSDYRPNNLMIRYNRDGSVDIKIVDLQTLQGGSPVTDLLYFIFTGSDEQFRAEYYDKLIDHYYAELSAALKRLHLNPDEIYSRQHFDQELQEKLPFGLALAVFTLPVITVDTDKAPKVNESMEITDFSVSNTSALYKERLNGVINDYVRWGVLK